ncbi:MAG TPA: family 20 glycosylhydrolase [Beutenbergiaceae bacterium]|nr:family 20 glycosylhydrolase [Beutenbergiaceae bacterium]
MENSLPEPLVGPVTGRCPRFQWRGFMIDSARTRFSVPIIKRVITLAARYGFNILHWHLTDDQGWRFEVPGYPRLTEAAYLPRDTFDDYHSLNGDTRERAIAEAPARWTNGYYSDAEIAEVVEHATSQGIEVVPEVDLPGHMMAAITAYPHLGRPAGLPLPEGSMREHMWWPARNDLLWPTEEAKEFVEAAMRRISELFPGTHVHIGGDECAYEQWASDPDIDDWLRLRGVTEVPQLQNWFTSVATEVLRENGKAVVAWDEATEITDDEELLIIAWQEETGMARAMASGLPFVFADARTLYLNRIDPEVPTPQKGMVPGITVSDILTAPWPETNSERCIGIQACVWSEFVLDGDDLLSLAFPRLLAVAERIWNPDIDSEEVEVLVRREYAVLRDAALLESPQFV